MGYVPLYHVLLPMYYMVYLWYSSGLLMVYYGYPLSLLNGSPHLCTRDHTSTSSLLLDLWFPTCHLRIYPSGWYDVWTYMRCCVL